MNSGLGIYKTPPSTLVVVIFSVLFESVELELLVVLDVTLEEVTSPTPALTIIVNDAA